MNESNLKEFLNGWRDNRVRMLMFDSRKQPCLRYLAVAFSFRDHAVAGYCNTARLVINSSCIISFGLCVYLSVHDTKSLNEF